MRVFVSYTFKDPAISEDSLRKIETQIEPFAKVFIDKIHNKKGGQRRVDFELWRSDIVLHLSSSSGYSSKWVQKELITARKKEKPIVKVSVDDLLQMDDEQLYLLLNDVEKKPQPVGVVMALSLLTCLGISLVGIWASYKYVSLNLSSEADINNARGLFGDSWGGVNAIISAFAFAGVIVTLFLQNRDLNLQRKEMARQREEFEKENETLKYQRFENLFYNMMNLQERIVDGLRITYESVEDATVPLAAGNWIKDARHVEHTVLGRDCFRYAFEEIEVPLYGGGEHQYVNGFRRFLKIQGCSHYDDNWIPSYFDHYFRHLYRILKFVDTQKFTRDEAYKYTSLLRGTLSRYELVWIYYNSLYNENVKLRRLVEKYGILKNMRRDLLTISKEYWDLLNEKGLSPQDVQAKGFWATDYDYYLTDRNNDPDYFYVGAFCSRKDMDFELEKLDKWRTLVQ